MSGEVLVFSAELIAPCGMNCALCSHYLAYLKQKDGPHRMVECTGCRTAAVRCAIKKNCERFRQGDINLCSDCEQFPCSRVKHIDKRYRTRYNYSMIETLEAVSTEGIQVLLAAHRARYRCPRCGGVICIHNGKCYACDDVKSWRG